MLVIGLLGQTKNTAIVVKTAEDLENKFFKTYIYILSNNKKSRGLQRDYKFNLKK